MRDGGLCLWLPKVRALLRGRLLLLRRRRFIAAAEIGGPALLIIILACWDYGACRITAECNGSLHSASICCTCSS